MACWKLLAALCAGSLAACGAAPVRAPEPVVRTVEVKVAVPVACIYAMPARPEIIPLAKILARPNADAAALLLEQVGVRDGYIGELEAVATPCAVDALTPAPR